MMNFNRRAILSGLVVTIAAPFMPVTSLASVNTWHQRNVLMDSVWQVIWQRNPVAYNLSNPAWRMPEDGAWAAILQMPKLLSPSRPPLPAVLLDAARVMDISFNDIPQRDLTRIERMWPLPPSTSIPLQWLAMRPELKGLQYAKLTLPDDVRLKEADFVVFK